jgi:hypothetical protein
MISHTKANDGPEHLQIGDHVKFLFGVKRLHGIIIEDRGRVGVGGQQLFLIEVPLRHDEPMRVEMPEDELEYEPDTDSE